MVSRFRRISGSSSITRMVFILKLAGLEQRQGQGHGRSFSNRACDYNLAAMQFDASLHNRQPQAGAWDMADVLAAMESVEQPFQVLLRDADASIANPANCHPSLAFDFKINRAFFGGILDGIAEEVAENVAQQ